VAGGNFSVAIKSGGTVAVWGSNDSGQTTVPGDPSNVVAIDAGGSHVLAVVASK
jgi:alpha-tubulin suppressor-like RCC1 family protein